MDVMFYEAFAEEKAALKRLLPGRLKAGFTPQTTQAGAGKHPPAKLISTRTQSVVPKAWAKDLSGILTRSTGFDHLTAYRKTASKKIPCGYLPKYCARSVAEHALLTAMALFRSWKRQLLQLETFDRDGITGTELFRKNLLVAGVGNIGEEIVHLAVGMGMHVRGVDRVKRLESLTYVSLEEGIPSADLIVCALPLLPSTKGLLNYDRLRHAKKGAVFVNVGRGEVSPTKDLKRLLDRKVLGGLGLDVYEGEQALAGELRKKGGAKGPRAKAILALQKRPNVILTPHNAFNTAEALERKAKQTVESVISFLAGGAFSYPIAE